MTELHDDVNWHESNTEPSRARQRKTRRERSSGESSRTGEGTNQRNTSPRRAARRSGPTMRERLVATHINLPGPSLHSMRGKVSSALHQVADSSLSEKISRKLAQSGIIESSRKNRRKSENLRSESLYEATSRAETQRKTGNDHSFIPRKSRRIYDARAESAPPVMVRGGMGGMAFGRVASSRVNKHKAPKRRFDVPLKAQGAEVRLPSIPLLHIGWRAVSLLLVFMLIASLYMMWKTPAFQVKTVEAEGLKRLTVGDLNTVMGTLGASVFTLNPNSLEDILQQAFPEFEKISVRVNLPAKVKVEVVERQPVIAWNQDGNEFWVDAQGVTFPPRGELENSLVRVEGHGVMPAIDSTGSMSSSPDLPPGIPASTASNKTNLRLSPVLVSSIVALGAKMPADTTLVFDSEHGLGWTDPNGWEVYFGAEDQDMQMKLTVYEALVDQLKREGIQPEIISVEYVHAPYYRTKR